MALVFWCSGCSSAGRELGLRFFAAILMVEFANVCIDLESLNFLSAVQVRSGVGGQRRANGVIRNRDHSHRRAAGSATDLGHWLDRLLWRMARR